MTSLASDFAASRHPGSYPQGTIPVLGLIGGIGSGKSQVASALARWGAYVLDADAVGHGLLEDPSVRGLILARFGPQVRDASHPDRLDRRALGAIVFADPTARQDLEAILHPRMREAFEQAIDRASRDGRAPAVVLDAAVLLEAGWNDLCDGIIFVEAPESLRHARIAAQRGWSADEWKARERAQWPLDQKRRQADWVVVNDADLASLHAQIDQFWDQTLPALQRAETPPHATRNPASAYSDAAPPGEKPPTA